MKQLNWYQIFGNVHTIPEGSTVTPTDDVQILLHCANIWDKSYTTIGEVIADDDTLFLTLIDNNAIDYLVRSTTFASSIVASEDAMEYIGASDYASETLLSDSTWAEAIISSAYVDYIANVQNPNMTSNTAPSGQCIGNSTYSGYEWYKAFDGNDATYGIAASSATTGSGHYLGYLFPNNVNISCVHVHLDGTNTTYKLQDSSDGETWNDASDNVVTEDNHTFLLSGSYKGVRAYKVSSSTNRNFAIYEMDIYGRENAGVQTWLKAGGVEGKKYTTVSEVLSDLTTLAALMSSSDAIDYLVTAKGWATEICSDSNAMADIGLSNYASNTLLADETWCKAICNSTYWQSVINVVTPNMTGYTTPRGEVIFSDERSDNYAAWKAFDGNTTTQWEPNGTTGNYVGYDFGYDVRLVKFSYKGTNNPSYPTWVMRDFKIQGSADKLVFDDVESFTYTASPNNQDFQLSKASNPYRCFRQYCVTGAGGTDACVCELKFYGRKDI